MLSVLVQMATAGYLTTMNKMKIWLQQTKKGQMLSDVITVFWKDIISTHNLITRFWDLLHGGQRPFVNSEA